MSVVRRSLAISALDSYLGLALQIAGTVIMSRLLTPEEVGVFAVAAVFAALASTFRDFGVAEYLIQEKELDDSALRAALTVNIMISWGMAALLFALAPAAARFYATPGVADVMRVQAFSFLLIPFGAVTMAWFRREMNFTPTLVAGLVSNAASFIVGVALALRGWGYMSLAWSSFAGVALTVACAFWFKPASLPNRPGLRGVSKVLRFGKFASGIYIFGQLGKGAPEMIIGRALDMQSVGMFSRAAGLVEIFNRLVLRAVTPVSLPYFARSVRETGSPKQAVLHSMCLLTAVGWPFVGFLAIAAEPAIRLMYGDQWLEAVPLAPILCAAAAVELLYSQSKEAMLSVGNAKDSNTLQILMQAARVAGLLAVVPFGLAGACWGLLGGSLVGAAMAQVFLSRAIGLGAREVIAGVLPSLVVAALALVPALVLSLWWPFATPGQFARAAAAGIATVIAWGLALRAAGHPAWPELARLFETAATKIRGRPSSP
ncbi:MAG: hypothetical protein LKCHEGNO_00077 [Burkholderiaceae bacterium]|nr:hypothetical protein [Burkholderiaceae bacterium]